MIPAIEGWGEASEFLSTQIPSHFYFLLIFFFLNPKFQNLSPIMQCKREQMGKSYVGKGFGGPQRREIWLLKCVTHQLAAATSPSPHELRMEPARGAQKEQAYCRKGAQLENIRCACAALKIWIKSGAAAQPTKEKQIPRLAWKTLSRTPSYPKCETGNWRCL